MYTADYFLMQGMSGLVLGSLYALMALGLTLIFSVLKVINFAHGEFYVIGGYLSYFLLSLVAGIPPIFGVLASMVGLFFLGALVEGTLLRPIHLGQVDRPDEYAILITFGLSFLFQNLILSVFGPFPKTPPSFLQGGWRIGVMMISYDRIIAAGIAIGIMTLMMWLVRSTWSGQALRAVSQNKDAASIVGINPLRMNTLAFAIGSALAGGSGALVAPIFSMAPDAGVVPSIRSFIIVVLGGMGSIKGAIIGGLIIGLIETLGTAVIPDPSRALAYKRVYGLIIFALVLLIRPQGLFGEEE